MSWSRCYPQSPGEVAFPQIHKPFLEDLELRAHNFLCSLLNVRAQFLPQHRGFLMVYVAWMACSPPVGDLELVEDQLTIVLGLSLYVTAMSWQSLPACFLRSRCVVCEPTGLRQEECLLGRTECGAERSGITPTLVDVWRRPAVEWQSSLQTPAERKTELRRQVLFRVWQGSAGSHGHLQLPGAHVPLTAQQPLFPLPQHWLALFSLRGWQVLSGCI